MDPADMIDQRLGPSAARISDADREWLIREMSAIEVVSRKLAEVEKEPLDFAAISPPPGAAPIG
jgi:hypothetical protein